MLAPTLDTGPSMRHGRDHPRKRPRKPHADKADTGPARSCRALLAGRWTAAKGWAAMDGSSNARWPSSSASAACLFVMNSAPIFTRRSSSLAVPSSALTRSEGFV